MKTIPLAEVSALAPYINYLSENGGDPYRYSDAAKIPRRMMESLNGRVTKVQANQFLELALEGEGLPDIGYRVGQGYGPRDMSALGEAILRSATLGEALQIYCLHVNDWWGGMDAWVERKGDKAWIKIRPVDGLKIPRNVSNQNGIYIFTNIIRLAAGPDWIPRRLIIPPVPGRAHENYPIVGEAEVSFDREEFGVEFDSVLLAMPMNASCSRDPSEPLLPHPDSPVEALSEVIHGQIRHGHVPDLKLAAEITQSSSRTLQRRLGEAGVSYRQLINRVRMTLARDLLAESETSTLDEVARESGFANARSLIHSFRRSTGMTPGEFRNFHRGS